MSSGPGFGSAKPAGDCQRSDRKLKSTEGFIMAKRILITGHNGYIGSVMAPHLAAAGHEVVGMDTGFFGECGLVPDLGLVGTIKKDIRDLTAHDLAGFNAVIHLA